MGLEDKKKAAVEYLRRGHMFEARKEVPLWGSPTEVARFYFEASAKLGNAEAMNKMGVYYSKGQGGLPLDGEKALSVYMDAASAKDGSARAKRNIATFHARGLGGLSQDSKVAFMLLNEVPIQTATLDMLWYGSDQPKPNGW